MNLRSLLRLCLLASLVLLAACSEQALYTGLSEQEANEMVAELSVAGISASKNSLKADKFSVSTSPDEFAQAVRLLKSLGLPKQRYDTLGEVFAKEGFVSSPLEERARLNHALSQEIASTLSSIDGVILARVHLAVPARNDLDDTVEPASASVFVKHRAGIDLTNSVAQIKALVVNGIENLPYENVTVALFESTGQQTESLPANVAAVPSTIDSPGAQQMALVPPAIARNVAGVGALLIMALIVVLAGIRFWRSRQG
ncbi:MAG: type III secretion inner membrane ring lipoprotein SctJ [Granulosicoccus sp.]|nr:type III secretion inner membrane ring lipoprotein SctJ [Granulosicoccus sp.]